MIIKIEKTTDIHEFKNIIQRINLMGVDRFCHFMAESMIRKDTANEFILNSSVVYLELDDAEFKEKWELFWSNYEKNGFFN